jgi:hypothetical protein
LTACSTGETLVGIPLMIKEAVTTNFARPHLKIGRNNQKK